MTSALRKSITPHYDLLPSATSSIILLDFPLHEVLLSF